MTSVRLAICVVATAGAACAFESESLPPVGCHPDGISYWGSALFANAMHQASGWMTYSNDWGSTVAHWGSPQFDTNGSPKYLNTNKNLRCVVYGLHNPANENICVGQYVVTWRGNADIRFGGTFVSAKSNCSSTGRAKDGRRVYRLSSYGATTVTVLDIDPADPITDVRLWMPDPADPQNLSLEGQFWHPLFLRRIADAPWGVLRMMNVQDTNANPQRDWSDRRPPQHAFMAGVLNPRAPASGFAGNRGSGMAFEHIVDLCNRTTNDMWICVPHLATDAFVTNLACLIRYGSDGVNPYTNAVANPTYPPLATNRRVFIEYSNEIWSNGNSFPQGNWASEQASLLGITKEKFNARRFCQVWRIFQEVFGGTNRLVRVAAVWTANSGYTIPFLTEMRLYGPTLSPPVEPDVIACTTYFGNGIQDWAHAKAQAQVGTDDPWFYTTETFGSPVKPVSLLASDPYWTGAAIERHIDQAFDEWTFRLLSGDAQEGGGPDAVGIGGGFDTSLHDLALTNFPTAKPIVAYEGGPSIYTDYMDGGDSRDDGITTFMNAMNRRARIRDVYSMHLNMSKSKGLWMHMPFTLCSAWGKYGQWGHLEYSAQSPDQSPKYNFMLDWRTESAALRSVDKPVGAVPGFDTAHALPVATVGKSYQTDITVSGGDGERTVALVGKSLVEGLSVQLNAGSPDHIRVSGAPTQEGQNLVYLRVADVDGDAAWRTFTVQTIGGPNTVVHSDFTGHNPARSTPWTNAFTLLPRVAFSGWTLGDGAFAADGDGALVFSVNAPSVEANATLALAFTDREYLGFTLQMPTNYALNLAGAEVRFSIRRIDYHAPRQYAVLSSVTGFSAANALYTSSRNGDSGTDSFYSFRLPDTDPYAWVRNSIEFRIYGFSGQYGGHKTSLTSFKLTARTPYPLRRDEPDDDRDGMGDAWEIQHFHSTNATLGAWDADPDGDGQNNLAEYLLQTDPLDASSALAITAGDIAAGDSIVLRWPSKSNAFYRIDTRPSLVADPPWGYIINRVPGSPPFNVYTAAITGTQAFFRIGLESAP